MQSLFRFTNYKAVVFIFVLIAGYGIIRGDFRTSADIRLDSGDLRYRYFGIPVVYDRMPEPERSKLLALAAKSKIVTNEWRTCAIFPLRSTNNEDFMYRGWYFKVSVWTGEDPDLARLLVEDIAAHLRATNARNGLPASSTLLSGFFVQPDVHAGWMIKQGWRQDQDALDYMASKHFSPATTQP